MRQGTTKLVLVFAIVLISFQIGWAFQPKETPVLLEQKEFFKSDLYISTANVALDEVSFQMSNLSAWNDFFSRYGSDFHVYVDPRSGIPTNIIGPIPMLPGSGYRNNITLQDLRSRTGRIITKVTPKLVAALVKDFVVANREAFALDASQLGQAKAEKVTDTLWHVNIRQEVNGIPVRYAVLAAAISHGNLVMIGTEAWGNVKVDTTPRITADQALTVGFKYAGGRVPDDVLWKQPQLEIIPFAPAEHQIGDSYAGPVGKGYGHRLAWVFGFERTPEHPRWEVLVDAHTGELLAFQDTNHYAKAKITGGVYPLTSTEVCPSNEFCGTMQDGYPMPWANTGLAAPNNYTNSAGVFDYTSGNVTTSLNGKYVRISDSCGTINASAAGTISLGGTNGQHDCTTPGSGGAGNTASSRSAFYEVNRIAELARGWLPNNTWLQSQLTANVNINSTCNGFWNGSTINFYRSGGGCRNTGELAGVFDHEWGHGMDDNDSNGTISSSGEAYADIAAIYRYQASCVGHGFFWTSNRGCGQTSDGTGYNQNEAQVGSAHCDTNCSGVRDADWGRHSDNRADTPQNFVCPSCSSSSTGPCGRQVHCAGAPVRQAAWDLVTRDLTAAPFNYNSNTAFMIGNKLFYQGSGNVSSWHSCSCTSGTSNGCGSTNGYMNWITADDDNGNLNDGTPHMTAIYNAFNRHNIACSTPSPVNSGCSGGPNTAPTVTATAGDHQITLSWNSVSGASQYWILRTEGHAGCAYGKALIATVTGTSYTDTQVMNGRTYYYNVVARGSSNACFGPAQSTCASATPVSGPVDTTPPTTSITSPAAGSTVSGTITVSASASDNVGVKTVDFFVDGNLIGSDTTSPYSVSWNTTSVANGSHTLTSRAYDAAGNSGNSSPVSVMVSNTTSCANSSQLLGNPGFESGNTIWTATAGVITSSTSRPARTGSWKAWLNGYGTTHTDTLYQNITIPSGACTAQLSFWIRIDTAETTTTTAYDRLQVQIRNTSNTVLATLATYSNLNSNTTYTQKTFDLSAYKGQTIRVYFLGTEDSSLQTSFVIDDTAVNITQ